MRFYSFFILLILLTGFSGCAVPPMYPQQRPPYPAARSPYPAPRTSQSAAEVNQPWDLSKLPNRSAPKNPYLLVADLQPAKTAPPQVDVERLAQSSKPVQTPQIQTVPHSNFSVLNLGQDLMNELRPTNNRKWTQNHNVLQTAEFNGNTVTVKNIRYSKYESADQYTTRYYDAVFNLNDVRTLDLIVVPFHAAPRLAHVQASFGFADSRQLGMSIEARYEEGEKYDALGSALRQFELIYVFADERDLIRLGTDVNKNDVHIYRLKFEPNEVRTMFVDALQRANKLAQKPEFYHPLRNSCVTNLITHINKGRPKAVPKEYRTLLPGLMDSYVYDLKLVDTTAKDFRTAKENAKVNWLVEKYGDLEYFSAGIRQNMY
ncbi:MAG: DUF4105 domain-containing protein [Planctomycetaceae bacterium]|jgi:hypothetical protein|nr:DUF4105 domain-containing protein [Planctomycetaceae bacterium]